MDRVIHEEDLRENDGQEGRPAYVAYQGKVYDVSGSKMWREGTHVRRHRAGQDLTSELTAAPHNDSVFERVTLVGELPAPARAEELTQELAQELPALLDWFLARHPHPIAVHFPIAYVVAVFVLLILSLLTNDASFETAGYYMLWGGVVMAPVAIVLGVMSWSFNYGRVTTGAFMGKIVLSVLFLIAGVVALTLRVSNPGVFVARDHTSWTYLGTTVVMMLLVMALGWLGDVILHGK